MIGWLFTILFICAYLKWMQWEIKNAQEIDEDDITF